MPQNQNITAKRQPEASRQSKSTTGSKAIETWLAKFTETFGRELTPALIAIWVEQFSSIPSADFEIACQEALRQCRFFPVPADIFSRFEKREALALSSEAEREWAEAWDASGRDRTCELSEAGRYAVRLIGGWPALQSINAVKNEPFLRKDFIAAYGRCHEKEKLGLTDGQAKALLLSVENQGKPKQLTESSGTGPTTAVSKTS